MKNNIKLSILITVLLAFLCIPNSNAQDDDCNKTKVGVSVDIVDDPDNYQWLENDFGPGDESEWSGFTANMLVQVLSEYEPDITFFTLGEGSGDHHYHFKANLTLTVIGEEDINEHTGYWVSASLIANADCIPNRNWVLDAEATYGKDRDLKIAMKNLAAMFWPMDRNIISYEEDHPSAPRKPELNIQIEKDYISPLDIESRKTKVYAKVYDCRGQLVCDQRGNGQPVYYQDEIDRLDLKIGHCEGGYHIGNFMVIITYKDCNNEGEYKLENGIGAENKTIRFKTCQLGGPLVEEEKELIIRGLKIEVKPEREELEPGERTNIVITFNETDPDGTTYPIEGKELDVKINGLENGTIKAENGYTTSNEGKVVLNYKAGSNDELVRVTASFQPEDYPDKAEGKASITVKPAEYDANITLKKKIVQKIEYHKEEQKTTKFCTEDYKNDRSMDETIESSIRVYCKLIEVAEMPMYNQRWEYYEPINVNLSNFSLYSNDKRVDYRNYSGHDCASGGNRTTVVIKKLLKNKELVGVIKAPWIVVFDNDTGKALKIIPGGFDISYEFDERNDMKSVSWSEGTSEKSDSNTKTRKRSFSFGPVEDPIPDPTAKSSEKWIQDYIKKNIGDLPSEIAAQIPKMDPKEVQNDINPDVIVQFGDGKKSFGGRGRKFINKPNPYGFEQEEQTYSWQMTIKKKK